jgi:hypothetical protein
MLSLCLQDIVKYTEKAGEDTKDVKRALHVMCVVPKAANDMMQVGRLQGFDVSEFSPFLLRVITFYLLQMLCLYYRYYLLTGYLIEFFVYFIHILSLTLL